MAEQFPPPPPGFPLPPPPPSDSGSDDDENKLENNSSEVKNIDVKEDKLSDLIKEIHHYLTVINQKDAS